MSLNDFDQWLFSGCPITRVAKNTWRYDFTFEFNQAANGWNEVDGLFVSLYNNRNPFNNQLFDFNTLFEGMDFLPNPDVSVAVKRS